MCHFRNIKSQLTPFSDNINMLKEVNKQLQVVLEDTLFKVCNKFLTNRRGEKKEQKWEKKTLEYYATRQYQASWWGDRQDPAPLQVQAEYTIISHWLLIKLIFTQFWSLPFDENRKSAPILLISAVSLSHRYFSLQYIKYINSRIKINNFL